MKTAAFTLIVYLIGSSAYAQSFDNISLNGDWHFKTDMYNLGVQEGWFEDNIDVGAWDSMNVPGNWDLKNEYANYAGKAWYRKSFTLPNDVKGHVLRLNFESVYNDAQIWLNGQLIGENHLGFLPFEFDISRVAKYGGNNQLTVLVDNTFKRGAIWNWGGIRRPVWIEITDKVYLEYQHITAVPDLKKGTAEVIVDFFVTNKDSVARTASYKVSIFFKDKLVIESNKNGNRLKVEAETTKSHAVAFRIPKEKVHLWHFNYPNLYTSQVSISDLKSKEFKHSLQDRFGIRKVQVDGIELKLNGEVIRPVGFNLVAEDRTTGNVLPLWRIKQDVDLLKTLGVNMARLSHLPLPKEFLDYMDEKGIMIFEEVSLWGKDEMVNPQHPIPREWLERMIKVKYNHPSIIGWSVGNEIGYIKDNPLVMDYVKSAIKLAKSLDPHRLAVYVTHSASSQATDPVEYSDLIMLNLYNGWGERVDKANQLHPNKPIFLSEYGKHLNSEDPDMGVIRAEEMLAEIRNKPYVIGASLWTFNDYRSFWQSRRPAWSTPSSQNRPWGIVDVFRQPKRAFHIYKREHLPMHITGFTHSAPIFSPGQKVTTSFTIKPREVNDFPAYPLKGYTMVWQVHDDHGKILDGSFKDLATMKPGGEKVNQNISWEIPKKGAQFLKLAILDPQMYNIYDTTFFMQKPHSPKIVSIHSGVQGIRVVFEKSNTATLWKVRYGLNNLLNETVATINDYIDIPNLDFGQTYQFQLAAINNFGENSTDTFSVKIDEDEFPPIIRKTMPADGSFFVGYSVDNTDYLFDIQYGIESEKYDQMLTLRNVGVIQVPNLINGQPYYYRLRRRKQWGFASEWSHEVKVVPDGGLMPTAPYVQGVIFKGNKGLVVIEPVAKSIGYKILLKQKESQNQHEISYTSSHIEYLPIEDQKNIDSYDFYIGTVGLQGVSEFQKIDLPKK